MENKIKYLILAAFALTASFGRANALDIDPAAPKMVSEDNLEDAGLAKPAKILERPNVQYEASGLRNPFEQPAIGGDGEGQPREEEPLPELIVQGLIWEGDPKQAIINNKVVKLGDNIENVDIVEIDKEGVTVLFAGVEHKLTTLTAEGQQGGQEK